MFKANETFFFLKKESTKSVNRANNWKSDSRGGGRGSGGKKKMTPLKVFLEAVEVIREEDRSDMRHLLRVTSGDLGRQIHVFLVTYGAFEDERRSGISKRMRNEKTLFRGHAIEWEGAQKLPESIV